MRLVFFCFVVAMLSVGKGIMIPFLTVSEGLSILLTTVLKSPFLLLATAERRLRKRRMISWGQ